MRPALIFALALTLVMHAWVILSTSAVGLVAATYSGVRVSSLIGRGESL